MIIVKGLTKSFGRIDVLKNISFEIKKGETVGILGQNGAGKTTLMRILTTYLVPTSGEVIVAGKNVLRDPLDVRRRIGYLPETPPLYLMMTVKEYLNLAAELKDIPRGYQKGQIAKVLKTCHLDDVQNRLIAVLSKGYRQRVGLAQAILSDPEVLILDEPTSGLDPVQILEVRRLIQSLQGTRTILLSTHILSEIEQIAERLLIIKAGEIVADAVLKNLLQDQESLEDAFLRVVGKEESSV